MNDLDAVAFQCHSNSRDKGFWTYSHEDKTTIYLSKLALIHSEVTEVLEAIRKEKGDHEVVEEIADILIRTYDLWAAMVHDGYTKESLQAHLEAKMNKNAGRPHMHGVLA